MLDPQYFRGHEEKAVTVQAEETGIEARVVEVTELPIIEGQERPRFSVVLEGPLEPVLDQRMYDFAFPDGQQHSLFMVPIGPKGAAMRYELVFT